MFRRCRKGILFLGYMSSINSLHLLKAVRLKNGWRSDVSFCTSFSRSEFRDSAALPDLNGTPGPMKPRLPLLHATCIRVPWVGQGVVPSSFLMSYTSSNSNNHFYVLSCPLLLYNPICSFKEFPLHPWVWIPLSLT